MFKLGSINKINSRNSVNQNNQSDSVEVSAKLLLLQMQFAKQLNLQSLKRSSAFVSGLHQSKFRGRGMDYQESRVYQAGDDIRSLDWKVTARTNEPHTKLFQEEKERPTFIIVDTNQTMRFGTKVQFKSVLAAKLAALLGWVTINAGDRIGGMTFGINGIHSLKPLSGKKGIMKWITHLVDANNLNKHDKLSVQNCDLDVTLKQLRSISPPGSLIVIISDFYHLGIDAKQQLSLLRKNHDILALFVCDEFELQKPIPAQYGVCQQQQIKVIDTNNKNTQDEFVKYQNQHLATIKTTLTELNVSVLPIQTHDDMLISLKQSMKNPRQAFDYWLKNLKN